MRHATRGLRLVQPRGSHGARACKAGGSGSVPASRRRTSSMTKKRSSCCRKVTARGRRAARRGKSAQGRLRRAGHRAVCSARRSRDVHDELSGTFRRRSAILISTPASAGGRPAIVRPADVSVNHRGRGIYTRDVHDLFVRDPHATRLMVGETFNPPGHWSSFPPHKHDGRDGEPELEEIYHYRVNPPQGFGQQMLYAAGDDTVIHEVRDGDVVVLPYGYHPVSSPPGYHLYYLWATVGAERKLRSTRIRASLDSRPA